MPVSSPEDFSVGFMAIFSSVLWSKEVTVAPPMLPKSHRRAAVGVSLAGMRTPGSCSAASGQGPTNLPDGGSYGNTKKNGLGTS